jgi:hypothetical protein
MLERSKVGKLVVTTQLVFLPGRRRTLCLVQSRAVLQKAVGLLLRKFSVGLAVAGEVS